MKSQRKLNLYLFFLRDPTRTVLIKMKILRQIQRVAKNLPIRSFRQSQMKFRLNSQTYLISLKNMTSDQQLKINNRGFQYFKKNSICLNKPELQNHILQQIQNQNHKINSVQLKEIQNQNVDLPKRTIIFTMLPL